MLLQAFGSSDVKAVATALADDVVLHEASSRRQRAADDSGGKRLEGFLQKLHQRVDRDTRSLKLNFFRRAQLANTFKWRLLEKGIEPQLAGELTQALVLRLTKGAASNVPVSAGGSRRARKADIQALRHRGAELLGKGAYAEAIECHQELVKLDPRDPAARNALGIALARLARYQEAEAEFRRAMGIRAGFPEAHFNLAGVLQSTGRYAESEMPLRRALKLKPAYLEARISLGMTCVLIGRLDQARECYEMALRAAPRNAQALVGLGQIERLEGHFAQAEAAFHEALEADPNASYAWAALASLRKMTPADAAWVKRAEQLAASGLAPLDATTLRFAIGKYYDDTGDFARAFRSYQEANDLSRLHAEPYDRKGYTNFVDAVISARTPEAIANARAGASDSERPVFVLGMPRSGTSLVEQIIASHPKAHGAGEIDFWNRVVHRNAAAFWKSLPSEETRRKLARDYLEILTSHSADALRVVDKTPANATFLGIIHTTFPKARIILMRRDPIDTCLSCYFQQLVPALNWATDLGDLAHYYRESERLAAHWRRLLPPGTILEVPYAQLVSDQEKWTRRIIEFLGLPWDDRCLAFHKTDRAVATSSAWQVRQKLYTSSVGRWRNYEKFIGPLRSLADL